MTGICKPLYVAILVGHVCHAYMIHTYIHLYYISILCAVDLLNYSDVVDVPGGGRCADGHTWAVFHDTRACEPMDAYS